MMKVFLLKTGSLFKSEVFAAQQIQRRLLILRLKLIKHNCSQCSAAVMSEYEQRRYREPAMHIFSIV